MIATAKGYACLWNNPTVDGLTFRKGCFEGADTSTLVVSLEHSRECVVPGRLNVREDEHGLKWELEVSDTYFARLVVDSSRIAQWQNCSFDGLLEEVNGEVVRVANLYDLSLVRTPRTPEAAVVWEYHLPDPGHQESLRAAKQLSRKLREVGAI